MQISIHIPAHGVPLNDVDLALHNLYTPRNIVFFDELLSGFISVKLDTELASQCQLFLDVSVVPGDIIDNDPNYNPQSFITLSFPVTEVVSKDTIDGNVCQLFKFSFLVRYPKRKLNSPRIVLNASIKSHFETETPQSIDVLPDMESVGQRNLFDQLSVNNSAFYLPSLVVDGPSSTPKYLPSHNATVEASCSLELPLVSALVIRLKSTKPAGKNNELLVSFGMEASDQLVKRQTQLQILLHEFQLNFSGHIVNLNESIHSFPLNFMSDESIVLNFKLINNDVDEVVKQVNVDLKLAVSDSNGKEISNYIDTTWAPYIDFSLMAPPINNSLKSILSQPQPPPALSKKKYLLNNGSSNTISFKKAGSATAVYRKILSSSSVTVNLGNTLTFSSLYGLKLTFTGKLSIKLGETVVWKLQAINTSSNKLNLSLVMQGQAHGKSQEKPQALLQLIPAYTKSTLFSIYQSLKLDNNGIIVLDNDIRIGSLAPNSVFDTSIKITGISRGVFNLDGMNIFDMNTGEGLDFGKLVEVFVT